MSAIIVSGFARSGTSMMMRVLKFGKISIFWNAQRLKMNPFGCFEIDDLHINLLKDSNYVKQFNDVAIKITGTNLFLLPAHQYKIIYMIRDLEQIAKSRKKIFGWERGTILKDIVWNLKNIDDAIRTFLFYRSDIEVLYVEYAKVFTHPDEELKRISNFIGDPFDAENAKNAIDFSLYKER